MTTRLHKLAVLSAVLAAGTLAPPALAAHSTAAGTEPVRVYRDLWSPDARDAALHPHYLPSQTVPQPPTWPRNPQVLTPPVRHTGGSESGDGLGAAPLAGIIAAAAAALAAAARVTLRRRQARPVA
jgi:hypothetical protein